MDAIAPMLDGTLILDEALVFDPAQNFDSWTLGFPPRWAVVLLADEAGRPIQLLCVKNLRYCIRRRLGTDPDLVPSRRIDYRQVVQQIRWRRVDSAFEADWVYFEIARKTFPETYQGMVGLRPAWFIHVDPEAHFPRYVKTIELNQQQGIYFGPVEDKNAAARLIELIEDAFDLCRYYHILIQAPHGRACAYKEMGKCPAPCDGSISIQQYHRLIDWSLEGLTRPENLVEDNTRRMQQAAGELRFEIAGRIKAYIETLSAFGKGAYRHARPLSECCFISLQRGALEKSAVVYLISPGRVSYFACLIDPPERCSDVLRTVLDWFEERPRLPLELVEAQRIGIVAQHLFSPRQTQGLFIPLAELTERKLVKAFRDLHKQPPAPMQNDEGLTREMQAIEPGQPTP